MESQKSNKTSYSVALAGQPNAGKTSIFNALTGTNQNVGNYPGVTVEKRQGRFEHDGLDFLLTDLPGTYSLSSFTPEERVAQNELLEKRPDVIAVVVDSTTLVRGLAFLTQVMQLGANTVLVLNMSDEAKASGQALDLELMGQLLACPVVETAAHKRQGIPTLKRSLVQAAERPRTSRRPVLGERMRRALSAIEDQLSRTELPVDQRRWFAYRLLLGDSDLTKQVLDLGARGRGVVDRASADRREIEVQIGDDITVFAAERISGFVQGLLEEVTLSPLAGDSRQLSDRIDRVLVHRLVGLPIFAAIMYGIFWITFTVGDYPVGWIEDGFSALGDFVDSRFSETEDAILRSLLSDGVIAGVGGVIVFLPNIVLLFLGLALLEDTGYMARAAFLMDRAMHKAGLHGKSFLPMITGFGCSVPGIMATRTLENERDRLATMLVLPLMSCGARLPIWMLLIPAFFAPALRAPVLGAIYLIGILLAMGLARLLRSSLLRGEDAPFVMELPPYRMPTLRALFAKMWERSWLYLRKAGTVILAIAILMWFITAFPKVDDYQVDLALEKGEQSDRSEVEIANLRAREDLVHSVAGRIGRAVEPVLAPLGFDWKLATGMIGAFAAKEVFVAQMGIVHALGETDEQSESLQDALRNTYTPLTGFCLMLFLLIATPCMATVAITKKESGRLKWALIQFFGLTFVAYILTLFVYQGGRLLGWG